jgi:hypothetical protein
MTMIQKLAAVLLASGLATTAFAQKASDAKTASEYFVAYHKAMSSAKTIEDLRPFMDPDQQKEMDKASKEEQEMGVGMISGMYADITDVKVVKETPTASGFMLDVTATQASDKTAGTGKVEISKGKGGWQVDSEEWKFGSSTMTLKKKKP